MANPVLSSDRPGDRWPPELALLFACGRRQLDAVNRDRANAALRDNLDGPRTLALGRAHGLLPLLALHTSSGALDVPEGLRQALLERTAAHVQGSLLLTAELLKLLRLCAELGIPVVPLKGPVLAQQIYGSVALRHIRDLDLLLRETDLSRLIGQLEGLGYRRDESLPPELDAMARRDSHHVNMTAPGERGVKLELHYCLLQPRGRTRIGYEAVSSRLQHVPFMDVQVPAFRPEDLLVYLCEHGAGHAWSRLEWVATVAELLRGRVSDWGRVSAWAAELGATRRVEAAILLADELFGAPEAAARVRSDWWMRAANRIVVRRLLRDPQRTIGSPGEHLTYPLLTDATWAARLRRFRTTMFVPSLADAQQFSQTPRSLDRAFRPVRLLIRHVKDAFGR